MCSIHLALWEALSKENNFCNHGRVWNNHGNGAEHALQIIRELSTTSITWKVKIVTCINRAIVSVYVPVYLLYIHYPSIYWLIHQHINISTYLSTYVPIYQLTIYLCTYLRINLCSCNYIVKCSHRAIVIHGTWPGFMVMKMPQVLLRRISLPSKMKRWAWLPSACKMERICCATTDSTSMLIRLNSSKQPQAPDWNKTTQSHSTTWYPRCIGAYR